MFAFKKIKKLGNVRFCFFVFKNYNVKMVFVRVLFGTNDTLKLGNLLGI